MKKNTHGNNKWQRKICSRTMKKVVETNSKRRKQLGIFRTYLIPKWTYESHEVCATLRQNIYYLMVVRLACVCVRLCIYKVCGCKRMRAFGRSLVRSFVCSYVPVYWFEWVFRWILKSDQMYACACVCLNVDLLYVPLKTESSNGDDDSSCSIANKHSSKRWHVERQQQRQRQQQNQMRRSMYWSLFIHPVRWKWTKSSEIQ